MTGLKQRFLKLLGRFAIYAVSQAVGKAHEKKAPSVKVIQTRQTLTKTTKQTKGEVL